MGNGLREPFFDILCPARYTAPEHSIILSLSYLLLSVMGLSHERQPEIMKKHKTRGYENLGFWCII